MGFFPSNYVERVKELPEENEEPSSESNQESGRLHVPACGSLHHMGSMFLCLFPFPVRSSKEPFFFSAMPPLLLLLFALVLSVGCSLPLAQKESLIALYNATGGPFWINNANWNFSTDPCTPNWNGVPCDSSNGNVTDLTLPNNNFPLSPECELFRSLFLFRALTICRWL